MLNVKHHDLLLSRLHYKVWEIIVRLARVIVIIMMEFYTMTSGFKPLRDNIKV